MKRRAMWYTMVDVVVIFAVIKGAGAGVTLGVHQDTDVKAANHNLRQLNPCYPNMDFLYLRYTALRPKDAVDLMRIELRHCSQTPWNDYYRTYSFESSLQLLFDRLSVRRAAALRVPQVERPLLLGWLAEDTGGAAWNFSKPLISYPPLKCYTPGAEEGAAIPSIDTLSVGTLVSNVAEFATLTANNVVASYTTAHPGAYGANISVLDVALRGDQSQVWCHAHSDTSFRTTLTIANDTVSENYVPCLVGSSSNMRSLLATSLYQYADGGVVITPTQAPPGAHSISIRALNPAGVYEVTTCGPDTEQGAYCVKGTVVYRGPTANTLQIGFSPSAGNVKYGVQCLDYCQPGYLLG